MIHTLHLLVRAERPKDSQMPPMIGHVVEYIDDEGLTCAVEIEEFGKPAIMAPPGYVTGLRSARFSASGRTGFPPTIRLLRIAEGALLGDWWWVDDGESDDREPSELFVRTDADGDDDYPYVERGTQFFREWVGIEPRDDDERMLREIQSEDYLLQRGLIDAAGQGTV